MTFYIHKDKLKVLPIGVEVPEKPTWGGNTENDYCCSKQICKPDEEDCDCAIQYHTYNEHVQSIISQGIEVNNKSAVEVWIEAWSKLEYSRHWELVDGEFYSLPDEEFEMDTQVYYKALDGEAWYPVDNNFTESGSYKKLAIIKPKSKPEDETLEEMDSKFSEASKKLMNSRPSKTYEVKPVEDEQEENPNLYAQGHIDGWNEAIKYKEQFSKDYDQLIKALIENRFLKSLSFIDSTQEMRLNQTDKIIESIISQYSVNPH